MKRTSYQKLKSFIVCLESEEDLFRRRPAVTVNFCSSFIKVQGIFLVGIISKKKINMRRFMSNRPRPEMMSADFN